jgi:uncharacterized RmlC-like cupin family protein
VTIEGLVKHFHGNPPTKAVDDLGLQIEEGEFLIVPRGVEHRPVAKSEAQVLLTVVGGKVVYERDQDRKLKQLLKPAAK